MAQQILGSHELKCHGYFGLCPPKSNSINIWLSWICTSMKKSLYFMFISGSRDKTRPHSFLTMLIQKKFSQLLLFVIITYQHELKWHGCFGPCPPKSNWINIYLSWICTSMKKKTLFHLFKTLNYLLICVKLCQHAKKSVSSISSFLR